MAQAYRLIFRADKLMVLVRRTAFPLSDPDNVRVLGGAVRKAGAIVQARAVRNVSGYPVTFAGGVFRVQVRTGTLKGSIELQWPYQTALAARVYVNGAHTTPSQMKGGVTIRSQAVSEYAGSIEWGHKEIDLKKTMKGKIVPFFGAENKKARGPYAARGLKPTAVRVADPLGGHKFVVTRGYGSKWASAQLDAKLAARGKPGMVFTKKGSKQGGSYFISFRRVGNTGWVIPAAAPRPFMRAALEGTKDQTRKVIADDAATLFRP